MSEAVGIGEYDTNIRTALGLLSACARRIVVIGEPRSAGTPP
ncbi:hypothetical protein [Nocardia farcinica]|nr:hypothetical protein [Nocardia farcinica]